MLIESYSYTTSFDNKQIVINEDISTKIDNGDLVTFFGLENISNKYSTIDSIKVNGLKTEIVLKENVIEIESYNRICIAKTYPYSLDEINKTFSLDYDSSLEIGIGDLITMWDGNIRLADYTVKSTQVDGNRLRVKVSEEITNDTRGRITITKLYSITDIKKDNPPSPSDLEPSFAINGGEDDKAVTQMIDFLKRTFINIEGFHVIEHPLLRPKNKALQPKLTSNGDLYFSLKTSVFEAKASSKKIVVEGDYTSGFKSGSKAKQSVVNFTTDGESVNLYVDSVINRKSKNRTEFKVVDEFTTDIINADIDATLSIQYKIVIEKIDPNGRIILASNNDGILPQPSDKVEIKGSTKGINDAYYFVNEVDGNSISLISDKLMPVILDKECSTQIIDPYTCIASVILPYWPERFNNSDFRKFFEQTLRMEAPAHVFLRICWVNTHHLQNLEKKYKRWIIENSSVKPDQVQISIALSELIDSLFQLRNVYPVGTLYDPEEHETLQNAIILNNTMIGNA